MFSNVQNAFQFFLLIGSLTAVFSAVLVLLYDPRNKLYRAWFGLTFCSAVWGLGYYTMISTGSLLIAENANIILHYAASLLPAMLLVLNIYYTDESFRISLVQKRTVLSIYFLISFFFILFSTTDYLLPEVSPKMGFNFVTNPGVLYPAFTVYFFLGVFGSLLGNINYFLSGKASKKLRFNFIIILIFVGAAVFGGGSVFPLTYNVNFLPYPLFLFAFYPIISAFGILKTNLFEVRGALTHFLVYLIWLLISLRIIFSSSTTDLLVNIASGLLIMTVSIFLILTVNADQRSKEKIEALAKKLEETNVTLKKSNQLKSEFVSIASHQLRSPLTAIKGYTSMILDGSFGEVQPKQRVPLERVQHSTESLVQIVQDFLDTSRLDQGKMNYHFEVVDMEALLKESVEDLMPNIQQTGLEFIVDTSKATKKNVYADMHKIKQVVLNLIDNALKYTKSGFVRVYLESSEEKDTITFSVHDSGMGMNQDTVDVLFKRFSRADNADQVNVAGTGLGLYIAKSMIENHRGRIWASSPGVSKGSTFTFEIPLLKTTKM